jgi:hypothetical protein
MFPIGGAQRNGARRKSDFPLSFADACCICHELLRPILSISATRYVACINVNGEVVPAVVDRTPGLSIDAVTLVP